MVFSNWKGSVIGFLYPCVNNLCSGLFDDVAKIKTKYLLPVEVNASQGI